MRRVVLPSLLATLVMVSGVARSQDAVVVQPPQPPASPTPAPAPQTKPTSVYVVGDYLLNLNSSEVLQTRIDLEAKDMPALDAIKSVLDQAKVKYEIAPDVTTDAKITMTLKNVPASYALMILTREAKVGWSYEKKDNQETFRVVKRDTRFGGRMRIDMPDIKVDMPQVENAFRTYMNAVSAAPLATNRTFSFPATLPDVRIKIDARNADVRDTLKKILEQAKLDYVLDDDIPSDVKRSFSFENIPLSTALDVVCQSVEIGWRAEMKDKKIIVMVGKKYSRRSNWITAGPRAGVAVSPSLPATIYASPIAERRATFTCPHCKARAVVVLRNERTHAEGEVKDKDKEGNRPWKFCPVCGKPIDMGANVRNDSLAPLTMFHTTSSPMLMELDNLPFFHTSELTPLIKAEAEAAARDIEFPEVSSCDVTI